MFLNTCRNASLSKLNSLTQTQTQTRTRTRTLTLLLLEAAQLETLKRIRAEAMEWASTFEETGVDGLEATLSTLRDGVPFIQGLHDKWALFYYMAMLSCSTVIVAFDEIWLKSDYAKGEWHLFAR